MAASMKFRVFWDVLPCSQMTTDVSEVRAASIIRATYIWLHGSTSQKILNFINCMMFRIVFWDVLPCSQMTTDVSEVRADSIIGATSIWLQGSTSQKILNFINCMMFRIVFWDVLPCKLIVDRRFRGGVLPPSSTAVHPRRQFWTSYSPPWELEISLIVVNKIIVYCRHILWQ
jgi:hypothetical protein